MNQRDNAQASLRVNRAAYLLLLMVAISLSGCAIASETNRVFYLAKRTTQIEPKFYRYIRSDRLAQREARKLAEQAWAEYLSTSDQNDFSPDFENGFVEGFADYLYRGGSGEPPVIPPRGYWNLRFLNQFGKVSIHEWYQGFRQGAQDCKARGLRELWVVPTSLLTDAPADDVKPVITQPEESRSLDAFPGMGAPAPPAPAPDDAAPNESATESEATEDAEQDSRSDPPDAEPEPPIIIDDEDVEGVLIDDSLSIRQVQPATRIPASAMLEQHRKAPFEPVVQATNHVDDPGRDDQEEALVNEFRNLLRQSKANENRLRSPAPAPAPERLRIVFEPGPSPAATSDELNDFPVIPLELSPRGAGNSKPSSQLSAPTNWQADGRSQELPLKVDSSTEDESNRGAPDALPPEQEFEELKMLLRSADAKELPRIIHKSDRAEFSSHDVEGANVIRWRMRD